MSRTVYLSGGMQYARGTGASWRAEMGTWVNNELGHSVIDPVHESEALLVRLSKAGWKLKGKARTGGDWPRFFRKVVDRDTRFVRSSDYLICLWDTSARRGAGTQGELTLARDSRIPVFLVTRSPVGRIPGWVQGCTTARFASFRELKIFLLNRYRTSSTGSK